MNKITEWALAEKLQASNKKGIILGICIAFGVILIVSAVILKVYLIKKHFGCCREIDFFEDDFDGCCCQDQDCDCLASEKDFV